MLKYHILKFKSLDILDWLLNFTANICPLLLLLYAMCTFYKGTLEKSTFNVRKIYIQCTKNLRQYIWSSEQGLPYSKSLVGQLNYFLCSTELMRGLECTCDTVQLSRTSIWQMWQKIWAHSCPAG